MNDYYLCGFLNLHAVFPNFVYPVFTNKGKEKHYYLEDGKSAIIQSFYEIPESELVDFYKYSEFSKEYVNANNRYVTGDKTVYAFMKSPNHVILGDDKCIVEFLMNYREGVEDALLKEEIDDFLTERVSQTKEKLLAEKKCSALVNYYKKNEVDDFAANRLVDCLNGFKLNIYDILNLFSDNAQEVAAHYHFMCYDSETIHQLDPLARYELINNYIILRTENAKLVEEFKNASNLYASIVLEESYENEGSTCIGIDEFIKRMLEKKTWLFPKNKLSHFYKRYLESFPDILSLDLIAIYSSKKIQRAQHQLQDENEMLKKILAFLIDVLEDRGINYLKRDFVDIET